MKLATYLSKTGPRTGSVTGDRIIDLAVALDQSDQGPSSWAATTQSLLAAGQEGLKAAAAAVEWHLRTNSDALGPKLGEVQLLAPLPNPGKLMCLAGNYADHILEGGGVFPGKDKMTPHFFMKPTTAVIGPDAAIRIPPSTKFADWELELAVVIGQAGRGFSVEEAQSAIVGYTIFNDISARELSFRDNLPMQEGDGFFDWLVGKWLDTFGPMGPWITTADEITDPSALKMQLFLNDELQQDASTGQMIFSPAEALAFITQFVMVEPGDMISMGTPAGVGHSKKLRLKPGDRIRGEIAELGTLSNPVEALS